MERVPKTGDLELGIWGGSLQNPGEALRAQDRTILAMAYS